MKKNAFEKLVNEQLEVCNTVFNSDENYEKYTKSIQLKKNTWIEWDFMYPTDNGSCWCLTLLFDDGSYSSRRIFSVNDEIKNDGTIYLDMDSLYERYKKINR